MFAGRAPPGSPPGARGCPSERACVRRARARRRFDPAPVRPVCGRAAGRRAGADRAGARRDREAPRAPRPPARPRSAAAGRVAALVAMLRCSMRGALSGCCIGSLGSHRPEQDPESGNASRRTVVFAGGDVFEPPRDSRRSGQGPPRPGLPVMTSLAHLLRASSASARGGVRSPVRSSCSLAMDRRGLPVSSPTRGPSMGGSEQHRFRSTPARTRGSVLDQDLELVAPVVERPDRQRVVFHGGGGRGREVTFSPSGAARPVDQAVCADAGAADAGCSRSPKRPPSSAPSRGRRSSRAARSPAEGAAESAQGTYRTLRLRVPCAR